MCAYKLCTVEFKWFGIQGKVEKYIQSVNMIIIELNKENYDYFWILLKTEKRLFTKFHKQLFCWIDDWYGLTMNDIRRIEDETQKELQKVTIILYKCVQKKVLNNFKKEILEGKKKDPYGKTEDDEP